MDTEKILGFDLIEDENVSEANSAWLLTEMDSFADHLKNNIDDKTEMKIIYREFTKEEWMLRTAIGKQESGEALTSEEQASLDSYLN